MVDLPTQDYPRAHIRSDVDQDEGFLPLRGAEIALTLSGQVGIVFNDDQAIHDPG